MAHDVRQPMSHDVRQPMAHDVRQSLPHDVRQSLPHDVRQSLPHDPRNGNGAARATPPHLTWIGPMEVMMEGCRYRLVPADAANANGSAPSGPHGAVEPLTPRETQIARLVADGLVNKEIATKLSISEWTVSTHMRRIFAKLGVETRAAMVLRCFGTRQ